MRKQTLWMIVSLAVLALFLNGCIWAPELEDLRREIEREVPGARFESEFKLTLGPTSLGFARMVTSLVPDAREANEYLTTIRRVTLAVYRTESLPSASELRLPRRVRQRMKRDGWEIAVKAREQDGMAWILYREHRNTVRDLYVIALDRNELVLVRVEGRLDRLLQKALQEHGDLTDVL